MIDINLDYPILTVWAFFNYLWVIIWPPQRKSFTRNSEKNNWNQNISNTNQPVMKLILWSNNYQLRRVCVNSTFFITYSWEVCNLYPTEMKNQKLVHGHNRIDVSKSVPKEFSLPLSAQCWNPSELSLLWLQPFHGYNHFIWNYFSKQPLNGAP